MSCRKAPPCQPSGGGWHPDPLLEIPTSGIARVPAGLVQPIFLTLCIARDILPGKYSGRVSLAAAGGFADEVNITVEVWPIVLPSLQDGVLESTWTFGSPNFTRFYPDPAPHIHTNTSWYPPNVTFDPIHNRSSGVCCSPMQRKWFKFFEKHRTPADPYGGLGLGLNSVSPTGSGPSLIEERSLTWYELMNSSGSTWMFLDDVTWCPGTCSGAGHAPRCPQNYSKEFVGQLLTKLEPEVEALRVAGLLNKSYVYGSDECPPGNKSGMLQMFAAVKSKWPELRTKTSLQYAPSDISVPIDTWAQTYMDFYCEKPGNWEERHNHHPQNCTSAPSNRVKKDAWQSAGKKYWW